VTSTWRYDSVYVEWVNNVDGRGREGKRREGLDAHVVVRGRDIHIHT
jgi:hypothetical protein